MKIILLCILAVAMIGLMVPNAFAEEIEEILVLDDFTQHYKVCWERSCSEIPPTITMVRTTMDENMKLVSEEFQYQPPSWRWLDPQAVATLDELNKQRLGSDYRQIKNLPKPATPCDNDWVRLSNGAEARYKELIMDSVIGKLGYDDPCKNVEYENRENKEEENELKLPTFDNNEDSETKQSEEYDQKSETKQSSNNQIITLSPETVSVIESSDNIVSMYSDHCSSQDPLKINLGEDVTFVNYDGDKDHRAFSLSVFKETNEMKWNTGYLKPGGAYITPPFYEVGEFTYSGCPGGAGTIIVEGDATMGSYYYMRNPALEHMTGYPNNLGTKYYDGEIYFTIPDEWMAHGSPRSDDVMTISNPNYLDNIKISIKDSNENINFELSKFKTNLFEANDECIIDRESIITDLQKVSSKQPDKVQTSFYDYGKIYYHCSVPIDEKQGSKNVNAFAYLYKTSNKIITIGYFENDDEYEQITHLLVGLGTPRSDEVQNFGFQLDENSKPVKGYSIENSNTQNQIPDNSKNESGGGCLIATAAFGSEMAPQVQFLREIRDNTVLQTQSGTTFMNGFNQFYYSFSPQIADYERENPVFKEAVKVTLTPLLTSLTLLNYVEIDSEEEMLGYGIGIILLNVGMYFVAPAAIILQIKKWKSKN